MEKQPSNKELTLLLIGSLGALVMAGVAATELDTKLMQYIRGGDETTDN